MHPEILRELTAQRGREMRARARQAKLARTAIWAGRRRRNRPDETGGFVGTRHPRLRGRVVPHRAGRGDGGPDACYPSRRLRRP